MAHILVELLRQKAVLFSTLILIFCGALILYFCFYTRLKQFATYNITESYLIVIHIRAVMYPFPNSYLKNPPLLYLYSTALPYIWPK